MQHLAAAEGHEKMVEYLLMSQANPNCKDRWGGTPLQVLQLWRHSLSGMVLVLMFFPQ